MLSGFEVHSEAKAAILFFDALFIYQAIVVLAPDSVDLLLRLLQLWFRSREDPSLQGNWEQRLRAQCYHFPRVYGCSKVYGPDERIHYRPYDYDVQLCQCTNNDDCGGSVLHLHFGGCSGGDCCETGVRLVVYPYPMTANSFSHEFCCDN